MDTMAGVGELGRQLRALESGADRFRVLDVEHSAEQSRVISSYVHWGVFYFLPPASTDAEQVKALFDDCKSRGLLHFSCNTQGTLGIEHAPVLTTDLFAFKHFEKPARKMLKVQWSHRKAYAELREILDALRRPFAPDEFPHVRDVRVSDYRPPAEGRQTLVALMPVHDRWRTVTELEDALRIHLAEANLPREILVGRHQVKGLQREVLLTSTEATSAFGQQYLTDLAEYILANPGEAEEGEAAEQDDRSLASAMNFVNIKELHRPREVVVTPEQLYHQVLNTLADTLGGMRDFAGDIKGVRGPILEIAYPPKGLLGVGGHFDAAQQTVLRSAVRVVRATPGLKEGWSLAYRYDRGARVLRVRAGSEGDNALEGFTSLQ